jgi:tRNA(Ile)-lysidine synthase
VSRRAVSADVMATRAAVRAAVSDLPPSAHLLVACSGGPDSLALVAATAWMAPRLDLRATAIVVDHGLQTGSADVAQQARESCVALGLDADVVRVEVGTAGGPEAAARSARYAALDERAREHGSAAVLLGHTVEDQAETVLLRLARGSGARSLSAMAPVNGIWRRPFLSLPRAVVRSAAVDQLEPLDRRPWEDPHNTDPSFGRVRVRALLEGLAADLGPGVVLGLARSAELLRDDADALDALAADAFTTYVTVADGAVEAACDALAAMPRALRTRVIRLMALRAGCPGEELGVDQVRRVEELIVAWRGQGPVHLPARVRAERSCGRLSLHS